jgi:hypothetical protein
MNRLAMYSAVALMAGVTMLFACNSEKTSEKGGAHSEVGARHEHMDAHMHEQTASPHAAEKQQEFDGNRTCPVMGNAVNRELYVDHDGKRIYVCCEACIEKVKADPDKYLKKLEKLGEKPGSI